MGTEVGKAVFSRLSTDVSVNGIVGTRVYPHDVPPQVAPTYPLIVYEPDVPVNVSDAHDQESDLRSVEVEIVGIATTSAQAVALGAAVHAALHRQAGTWGGINVHRVFLVDGTEDTYQLLGVDEQRFVYQGTFRWFLKA